MESHSDERHDLLDILELGEIWDIEGGKVIPKARDGADGWSEIAAVPVSKAGFSFAAIELSWEASADARHYGYAATWPGAIQGSATANLAWECVSGTSSIPVVNTFIVAVIPPNVRASRRPTPHLRGYTEYPDLIGFHAQGDPAQTVLDYMNPQSDNTRQRHLFTTPIESVPLLAAGDIDPPEALEGTLIELGLGQRSKRSGFVPALPDSTFLGRVHSPEPLLHYGMVWPLPE